MSNHLAIARAIKVLAGGVQRRKKWRQHEVDEELKDEWLSVLNSIPMFKMISICYGHNPDQNDDTMGGDEYADINGTLHIGFSQSTKEQTLKIAKSIADKIAKAPDTKVEYRWTMAASFGVGEKGGNYGVVFLIKHTLKTSGNEQQTNRWFDTLTKELPKIFLKQQAELLSG